MLLLLLNVGHCGTCSCAFHHRHSCHYTTYLARAWNFFLAFGGYEYKKSVRACVRESNQMFMINAPEGLRVFSVESRLTKTHR